jgi:hypothetical protein
VHIDGGPGKGEKGRGAGHGGQGGRGSIQGGGLFYGDIVTPDLPGSNGVYKDLTTDIKVQGGGILMFDITQTAHIDGKAFKDI